MLIIAITSTVAKNTYNNGVSSPKSGIKAGTTT